MTRTRIGIDVGGTTTRVAKVDSRGQVLDRQDVPTRVGAPPQVLIDQWGGLIHDLVQSARRARQGEAQIGLAVAGLLDRDRRTVLRSVNLPMLEGAPLSEMLELATGAEVTLLTDIEAATGAEWRAHGAPDGRFVHLRIGTGIGCGIVSDGKFIEPERSAAGHADVLIIDDGDNAAVCACGRRGCLEAYVSGAALVQRAGESGLPADLVALRSACRHGDKRALELLAQAADKLASGIGRIAQVLSPEIVCVGGGVIELCPELLDAVLEQPCTVPIIRARLGNDAGVIGAATHCTYAT
jgi:glucokinase